MAQSGYGSMISMGLGPASDSYFISRPSSGDQLWFLFGVHFSERHPRVSTYEKMWKTNGFPQENDEQMVRFPDSVCRRVSTWMNLIITRPGKQTVCH
jgi:hypothetical protein